MANPDHLGGAVTTWYIDTNGTEFIHHRDVRDASIIYIIRPGDSRWYTNEDRIVRTTYESAWQSHFDQEDSPHLSATSLEDYMARVEND